MIGRNCSDVLAEAATIPLVTMTAAIALYELQELPLPWSPLSSSAPPVPIIIYGASSSLGCFAIKFAKVSNIHPIIAICGSSNTYVSSLIDPSKGDVIIDYRQGVEAMKVAISEALGGLEAFHALDAISSNQTWVPLTQMVSPNGGQVCVVNGAYTYDEPEIPAGTKIKYVYVGSAHSGKYLPTMPKQPVDKELVESTVEFAYIMFRYVSRMLAKGIFEGHPYEVVPGGLAGVEDGLKRLKANQAKGKKFIYRITTDTEKGKDEKSNIDQK
jgi:NADPH:quinone reductase